MLKLKPVKLGTSFLRHSVIPRNIHVASKSDKKVVFTDIRQDRHTDRKTQDRQ